MFWSRTVTTTSALSIPSALSSVLSALTREPAVSTACADTTAGATISSSAIATEVVRGLKAIWTRSGMTLDVSRQRLSSMVGALFSSVCTLKGSLEVMSVPYL